MKTFLESTNVNSFYNLNTLTYPVIVYLKITECCNLCCNFCSQAYEKKNIMDINLAKKILRELHNGGVVSINYTGGEPLLYPDLQELLKYGSSLGFEQTLITNGLNILKNKNILKYVNCIGISLHGTPEIHNHLCNLPNAFDKVKSNIDKLLSDYPKIKLNLNCTLTEENINEDSLKFLKNFAQERNIKLCFGRLNYLGLSSNTKMINPDKYLKIIAELKKEYFNISISNCIALCTHQQEYKYLNHACGAGISIFSIEPNGDVKICPSSSYILGNVLNTKFSKIIKNKKLDSYKKLNWLPNICRICKDFSYCKGGCHAEGNSLFYENTCDTLVIDKLNSVWEKIKNKKIISKCNKLRKEKNKYLIIKIPIRKIDKLGYKVLLQCDGTKTGSEIAEIFSKITNIEDFLSTLYLDNIIGVQNEKKRNC